jgi:peroxiredoxin
MANAQIQHDTDSLSARFAALQAERERSWRPEQLAQNRAQRDVLRNAFDPAASVAAGDRLEDAELIDTQGKTLRLSELAARGSAVLIFFRFATCPADDIALPLYDQKLFAPLQTVGIPLVAISPQLPERLDAIRARHSLRLTVASDPGNALARRLGLTFAPLDTPTPPPPGWIGEVTGTGTWELPQTSVVIVDADLTVRYVAISPDWLDRVEPQEVLAAALDRGTARAAAA